METNGSRMDRLDSSAGYSFSCIRNFEKDSSLERWRCFYKDKCPTVFAAYCSCESSEEIQRVYERFRKDYADRSSNDFRRILETIILAARDERFAGERGKVLQLIMKNQEYEIFFHEVIDVEVHENEENDNELKPARKIPPVIKPAA
jgi:hypothetical protein